MYKTAIASKGLDTAQRDIEDLTQVVISYEIYETSLWLVS